MLKTEQVKVFNQSIFDYNQHTKDPCFIIGMEILDNMPHDRLYKDSSNPIDPWTHQTRVSMHSEEGEEVYEEVYEEINDEWCQLYLDLQARIPPMDHISIAKEIDREGIIPRIMNSWRNFIGTNSQQTIFIPTATLQLFSHIGNIMPRHHLVFADFDSFLMPRKCVQGINAPLVTNKLAAPSDWESFNTYLLPPGTADI